MIVKIYTEQEIEYIRVHYKGTNQSAREIGMAIKRSWRSVKYQACKMGIATKIDKVRSHRNWTEKEKDQLAEYLEQYSIGTVAVKMNRSLDSVASMAKILGLSTRSRLGWYTLSEASEILGVSREWLNRRIDEGILKATQHYADTSNESRCWHIDESELRRFIRKYPQELTGRNIDVMAMVDILIGTGRARPDGIHDD